MRVVEISPTFSVMVMDELEQLDMRGYPATEGRLSEVYIKPDGALGNKPSLIFVVDLPGVRVVSQLSAEMFKRVFDELEPHISCRRCRALQSPADPCICK